MSDEKQKTENTSEQSEAAGENNENGIQQTVDDKIKQLNDETQRLNEAIARNENEKARAKLAGVTLNSPEQNKKEETPRDYYRKVLGK